MNVVLYGATGRSGSLILGELVLRGHGVTAIVRNPGKIAISAPGVLVKQGDLGEPKAIALAIDGVQAVVSAYAPPEDDPDALVAVTQRFIDALSGKIGTRLVMVGSSGGLYVVPGVTLLGSGYLPEEYHAIARAHIRALNLLRISPIDWTYLAPAAEFAPGERTGRYRLGKDELVANARKESRISMEDFAIALVDELERPRNHRQRFSVGY